MENIRNFGAFVNESRQGEVAFMLTYSGPPVQDMVYGDNSEEFAVSLHRDRASAEAKAWDDADTMAAEYNSSYAYDEEDNTDHVEWQKGNPDNVRQLFDIIKVKMDDRNDVSNAFRLIMNCLTVVQEEDTMHDLAMELIDDYGADANLMFDLVKPSEIGIERLVDLFSGDPEVLNAIKNADPVAYNNHFRGKKSEKLFGI